MQSIDIFCRVVDNYGDIGVCWRLARQLHALAGACRIRLWVDNLQAFARIQPGVLAQCDRQTAAGIEIIRWTDPAPDLDPADVVIEAFACDPPARFIERMKPRPHVWIDLEYLSAESWIESCHALPSRQASGMVKTFFFPGFTPATGGLLREQGLLDRRDRWLADPALRWRLLESLGLPRPQIERLRNGARQALLFCYPQAPAQALAQSLKRQHPPCVLVVPQGVYPGLSSQSDDSLYVHEAPFVDQDRFDELLWSADLNLVRGEDSLVRALWAGKPLVWQIYPQQDQVHLHKLDAWLARSPYSPKVHAVIRAWNTGDGADFGDGLDRLLEPAAWSAWRAASARWSRQLAGQADLAGSILAFCAEQWRKG